MTWDSDRALLEHGLRAGLAAVDGERVVRRALAQGPEGLRVAGRLVPGGAQVFVAAIGKAAFSMAQAAIDSLGPRVEGGVIVAPEDSRVQAAPGFDVWIAAHPVPDERSASAGTALLEFANRLGSDDVLLVLLSGGASALTSCPLADMTVEDLSIAHRLLLASGADITEINCLRKHLTAVAGGRLARAASPAVVHVLAISDVPGDRYEVIGSGPCAPDPTRFAGARFILEQYGLVSRMPARVIRHLEAGEAGAQPESLAPEDPVFQSVSSTIIACNADARRAARETLSSEVECALDLGEVLSGEARAAGPSLIDRALRDAPEGRPCVVVAGGETVVAVRGAGQGGRNQELALSAALAFEEDQSGRVRGLLAVGTDGKDGPTSAAGGYVDRESVSRARRAGLEPQRLLDENDSNRFLRTTDGIVSTGSTGTNVMDLAFVLLGPDPLR